MRVTTKVDVTDNDVKIPKGITGTVTGVQWGNKDGFVIDFPQHFRVFVKREDVVEIREVIYVPKKPRTAKEEREIDE